MMPIPVILIALITVFNNYPLLHSADISHFSLEDKIGQLMMISFEGTTIPEDIERVIREKSIGGIIYYRSNCEAGPHRVKSLSESLQNIPKQTRRPPLIIAIDQEGGRVQRLYGDTIAVIPSQYFLGLCNIPLLTLTSAQRVGEQLRRAGITMNFAPVADVITGPQTVIGDRSFSSDPHIASLHVKAALEGYKNARIAATFKHFPGHGSTPKDSHTELPVVDKTLQELTNHDLVPFSDSISQAPAIMTAHVLYPQIDPDNPATTSKTILQRLLRKQLGYNGVTISDSLTMEGILKNKDLIKVSIEALGAGCDILLYGKKILNDGSLGSVSSEEIATIHTALVSAVRAGIIPVEQIDQSVQRVLTLKSCYTSP